MRLLKWGDRFLCLVGAGLIILVRMGVPFLIFIGGHLISLLFLMSPQSQFIRALHLYDLECAIISALRSARMLTGQRWLTLEQLVATVENKLEKKFVQKDCKLIVDSLVVKKVVEEKKLSNETAYALIDSSYLPQKPEKIEASQRNPKGLLLI